MSVQLNPSVALQTQELIQDVLNSTDSIEKSLSRTNDRVGGFVLGCILNIGFGLPTPPLATLFLLDSFTDLRKSAIMRAHLAGLESIVPETESQKFDISVQKQIYSRIENYTNRAKIIKVVTAIAYLLAGIYAKNFTNDAKSIDSFVSTGFCPPEATSCKMWQLTGLLAFSAMCCALIHRYTLGSRMQAENKELAARCQKV